MDINKVGNDQQCQSSTHLDNLYESSKVQLGVESQVVDISYQSSDLFLKFFKPIIVATFAHDLIVITPSLFAVLIITMVRIFIVGPGIITSGETPVLYRFPDTRLDVSSIGRVLFLAVGLRTVLALGVGFKRRS